MLKNVTDILETMLDDRIDHDMLYIERIEYDWVHELLVLTKEYGECVQSISIVRQSEKGDYQIGIPDYDMTRYLATGNFNSEDNKSTCDIFMKRLAVEIKYKADRVKSKYQEIESLNMY